MGRKKAFTLIELLVVISIIAALMGILLSTLSKVRSQAKATVCMTNLKQWGVYFSLYTTDHDNKFSTGRADSGGHWMDVLYPYYSANKKRGKLRLCPTATKTTAEQGGVGNFSAWGPLYADWTTEGEQIIGSYGINTYVYNPARSSSGITAFIPDKHYWRTTLVGNATPNRIPLLLDAWWLGGAATENDVPPREEEVFANTQGGVNQMQRYCVNRHSAAVNGVFLDFSVRRIGLKELWTLKWHKEFNTRGHWTSADPDSSARWKMAAPWMAQMREY